MVLVLGSNGHELLVWVFFLRRIIRLVFLEVWSKSWNMVSDVETALTVYAHLPNPNLCCPMIP